MDWFLVLGSWFADWFVVRDRTWHSVPSAPECKSQGKSHQNKDRADGTECPPYRPKRCRRSSRQGVLHGNPAPGPSRIHHHRPSTIDHPLFTIYYPRFLLRQGVVQSRDQFAHCFSGLVSHVGKSECLSFQLAVASIDDDVVARLEICL